MSLCDLCRSIPFHALPSPLECEGASRIADNDELKQLHAKGVNKDRFVDPLGYSWHESLEALQESAKSDCSLCNLVQDGAQKWIANYQNEEKTNLLFIEFGRDRSSIPYGQQLWLTKRLSGGDGFNVLVREPHSPAVVNLLASVAILVEASNPLASRFTLRPVDSDSSSQKSLEVVASWLGSCNKNHEECTVKEAKLPSRVLDVGSSGDTVKLVVGDSVANEKYLCLSYRWGSLHTFTTTQQSYEAMISGIHISDLPKTFHDAIVITRYLGVRFLWIDSLCIIQDLQNDWARESAAMTEIYSGAYLTIAVNHAKDSSDGCFHSRQPRRTVTFNIPETGEVQAQLVFGKDERPWVLGFDDEPLCKRGWALQERILASRVLHYNSQQMYFECNHGLVSEDGCRSDRLCGLKSVNSDEQDPAKERDIKDLWYQLLWMYGQRKLTKATDKLTALSGLAKLLGSQLDDHYVAGLWSNSLIEGLAWQGLEDREPASISEYTGPSWSWASYGGIAATGRGFKKDWTDVAEVKGWHVDLKHKVNPYGEVTKGWIRIRGPLAKLTPSKKEITELEVRLHRAKRTPHPRLNTKYSDQEEDNLVTLDNQQAEKSGEWRDSSLYVLILRGRRLEDDGEEDDGEEDDGEEDKKRYEHEKRGEDAVPLSFCYGLVLSQLESGPELVMKRTGWMFINGQELTEFMKDKSSWTTVTLI